MQIIFNNFLIHAFTDGNGEVAALAAAGLWAVASVVYGLVGQHIPPIQLNLIKGIIAIALLLLTILISGELLPQLSPLSVCLLFLSGAVGIGWGDTAFLAAINYLGARRVLLLGTLSPPMTAIAATIFLHEQLNVSAWCGILLTILGVAWVVTERVSGKSEVDSTHLWQGIGLGLLAAITKIWLQQTAIKLTSVGIASTLLQTSPLFVIPIAIAMGEKVSLRAIAGVGIAIAGIGLLFYLK